MGSHSGITHHIRLSLDSSEALAVLMKRTGLNRNQAINFSILSAARGHDGYYAQMAAFQSAIAASLAAFAAQKMCETAEEEADLARVAIDLARGIHGPPPQPPTYLTNQGAHSTIATAFFDALASHYRPSK